MMKKILLLFLIASSLQAVSAQGTVLSPGDVVALQLRGDNPDEFAIVTFVELAMGTVFYVTDCGVTPSGVFDTPCGEGALVFTAAAVIPAGTIITEGDSQFANFSGTRITGTGGMSFATGGDQILVFQDSNLGNATDATAEPSFVSAVNAASTAFTGDDNNSSNETGLPNGLTVGVSAVAVGSGSGVSAEHDNVAWNPNASGPFANLTDARTSVFTAADWAGSGMSGSPTSEPYASAAAALNALGSSILPVEWSKFGAYVAGESVMLNWETSQEENNAYFMIERSTDGRQFTAIGQVEGVGTTYLAQAYEYEDKAPLVGKSYYRLQQVDFDGAFAYSEVVSVKLDVKEQVVTAYPNPTFENVQLIFPDQEDDLGTVTARVFDVTGKQVLTANFGATTNGTVLNVAELPAGTYTVKFDAAVPVAATQFVKL